MPKCVFNKVADYVSWESVSIFIYKLYINLMFDQIENYNNKCHFFQELILSGLFLAIIL